MGIYSGRGVQSLCKRSTQYLITWIASFRMAENVIVRGKLNHPGGGRAGDTATSEEG